MKCLCHFLLLLFLSFLNSELHCVILQLLLWTWHVLCGFCALNYFFHFGVDPCWSFLNLVYWLLYSKPFLYKHCLSLKYLLSFQCWEPLNFFLLVLSRKPQLLHNCDNRDLFTRIIIISLSTLIFLTPVWKRNYNDKRWKRDMCQKQKRHWQENIQEATKT